MEILMELDKKVTIKFLKEKKTNRTYITGLEGFLIDSIIENITTDLKRRLGTGMLKKNIEGIWMYGFQGDHRMAIKEYLVSKTNITEDKIKIT